MDLREPIVNSRFKHQNYTVIRTLSKTEKIRRTEPFQSIQAVVGVYLHFNAAVLIQLQLNENCSLWQ